MNLSAEEAVVEAETLLSRSGIHAGEVFKLAVKLKISIAWHINANPVSDEFLLPTTFVIEENENIRTLGTFYPQPKKGKFEYSEVELEIYSGQIILGALIQSAQDLAPGILKIKGKVSYQACNDRFCLPPKSLELEVLAKIIPASEPAEEINQDIFSKMEFEKSGSS
jgi:thiol:disulfide interchange protein DsbD